LPLVAANLTPKHAGTQSSKQQCSDALDICPILQVLAIAINTNLRLNFADKRLIKNTKLLY